MKYDERPLVFGQQIDQTDQEVPPNKAETKQFARVSAIKIQPL